MPPALRSGSIRFARVSASSAGVGADSAGSGGFGA